MWGGSRGRMKSLSKYHKQKDSQPIEVLYNLGSIYFSQFNFFLFLFIHLCLKLTYTSSLNVTRVPISVFMLLPFPEMFIPYISTPVLETPNSPHPSRPSSNGTSARKFSFITRYIWTVQSLQCVSYFHFY